MPNTATGLFTGGTALSNTVTFTVSPIADLDVASASSTAAGAPGATIYYPITVLNLGNSSDTVSVTATSAGGWSCSLRRDDNGDGVHQSSETAALTSSAVPMGGQIACFLAVTIPAGATAADMQTVTATSGLEAGVSASIAFTTAPTVAPPPTAAFSASPVSGTAPVTVAFTDLSTGGPTSWSWSFGDGGTSTALNPSHQYQSPGSYAVSLTVSNASGSNTKAQAGYITVNLAPPTAGFYGTPLSGPAPLTVSFFDQSSGSPTSWLWDFGDGSTSSQQNPTHRYDNPGNYSVTLAVTAATGTATKTFTGYVKVAAPPVGASFSATPTRGPAPLTVAFTDLSTGDPTSWAWDFGDGTTSSEQHPSHVYTSKSAYTVKLTVSGAGGSNSATRSNYIVVDDPGAVPVVDFAGLPAAGQIPLSVSFVDLSTGLDAGTIWSWDFGDGATSGAQNPVHVYQKQGTYSVTLTATNAAGSASKMLFNYIQARRAKKWAYLFDRKMPAPKDTPADFWARNEILALGSAGIAYGYPDGQFHPDWSVKRDQVAVFLSRAVAGGDSNVPDTSSQPSFSDVPPGHWAYRYVEYAKSSSVVAGYPDRRYRPDELVTRAQMAVFVARSIADPIGDAGLQGFTPPTRPTFRDVTPASKYSWAYKHVEYLVSEGMVAGYSDGQYRPSATISRDQLSVYLARAFGLVD